MSTELPLPQPPATDLCRISDIGFRYGSRPVLQGVSFTAERGEMVALVGSSGAGKTTLLRVITGMLIPGSGEVSLYGVRPYEIEDSARRTQLVGMMQQRLDLVTQLSVRHNADAGMLGRWNMLRSLASLVLPLPHPAADTALKRVGLKGRERDRVGRLSGGEQQRVALARVLVQDPEVIVADEPVASLDPALADELLGLLREIAVERSRTVIASLHTPELAKAHFDRVIGLKDGLAVFDVPSSDLSFELLSEVYEPRPQPTDGKEARPVTNEEVPAWGV